MAKSEVFNMDCMVAMAQFPDKYFDASVKRFENHIKQLKLELV
jgi:hypothetical protein